jgi:hypothetical protein
MDDFLKSHPHLKEFGPYLEVSNAESPRGNVLVSTGYIEEQLKRVLTAFMLDVGAAANLLAGSGNAPLGTFSARIAACYALGLISEDEHHDLTLMRRIRNDFAHDMHVTFDTPSVVSRCAQLRFSAKDYKNKDGSEVVVGSMGQFVTAASAVILHLTNRPAYVSRKKLKYGNWPY